MNSRKKTILFIVSCVFSLFLVEREKNEKRTRDRRTSTPPPAKRPCSRYNELQTRKLEAYYQLGKDRIDFGQVYREARARSPWNIRTVGLRTHTYTSCTSGSSCAMHPMRDGSLTCHGWSSAEYQGPRHHQGSPQIPCHSSRVR